MKITNVVLLGLLCCLVSCTKEVQIPSVEINAEYEAPSGKSFVEFASKGKSFYMKTDDKSVSHVICIDKECYVWGEAFTDKSTSFCRERDGVAFVIFASAPKADSGKVNGRSNCDNYASVGQYEFFNVEGYAH